MNHGFLSLGSNVDPEVNLRRAVRQLSRRLEVLAVSSALRTPAVGPSGQPPYLNAAVAFRTDRDAYPLKTEVLRPLERDLGRVRSDDRFAPRPIDIDITLWNDDELVLPDGQPIPDPDLYHHLHLALPLSEIAPHLIDPATGETLGEVADRLRRQTD